MALPPQVKVCTMHYAANVLHVVDTGLIENHFGLFVGSKDRNNAVLATKGKHVGIGRQPRTQQG